MSAAASLAVFHLMVALCRSCQGLSSWRPVVSTRATSIRRRFSSCSAPSASLAASNLCSRAKCARLRRSTDEVTTQVPSAVKTPPTIAPIRASSMGRS